MKSEGYALTIAYPKLELKYKLTTVLDKEIR